MKTENIKELRKEFPYLTAERIKSIIAGSKKKSYRGIKNEISRANSEYEAIATEPRLKEIEINIEWNKSRTWGYCPRATAYYTTFTGKYGKVSAYATGCGYDKASQVVADCLNQIGRGMIWARRKTRKPIPYGINISKDYVIKSIKVIKIYSTFCISHTTRTNGLLYLTGHNECPLLTILLT